MGRPGKDVKPKRPQPQQTEVVQDSRFARVHKDPRFQRAPKKDMKVKVDERFKSMFEDADFGGEKAAPRVDKYGRPLQSKRSEDMKRLYRLDDDDEEEDSDAEEEEQVADEDDAGEWESEEVESDAQQDSDEEEEEEEEEGSGMPASFIDRARGEGLEESDETDDDFVEEEADEENMITAEEDALLVRFGNAIFLLLRHFVIGPR